MKNTRREFLRLAGGAAVAGAVAGCQTRMTENTHAATTHATARPNVILIITDDQGYGDLACHGNPHIKTPNLDRLYAESTRLTQFHVCPVCTPTRASLMTGRYNYRTGAIDTYRGRAMMHPDEITVAEVLASNGYKTGIFGKWHLGDCYPLRAMDNGFQESLVIKGGGLGQPSDAPGSGYFDPVLLHNGKDEKYSGYCTDIYTNACIDFIRTNKDKPFFAYLPTNAPHTPLFIDEKYVEPYTKMGLSEVVAKTYGMIENVDENIGRLMSELDTLGLREKTIVIFMTDNGPQMPKDQRYNAGMRGTKATVYQGGIRVPFFFRWPGVVPAGRDVDRLAAHIDVMPTLMQFCNATDASNTARDGIGLASTLLGQEQVWPDRTIFTQWHRGDVPELYVACMARNQRFKMVNGKELYDLQSDPNEARDVSAERPEVLAQLRVEYEAWFRDVSATRGYDPPRIYVGAPEAPKVTLTQQDWRGIYSSKGAEVGHWELQVITEGTYSIDMQFPDTKEVGPVELNVGDVRLKGKLDKAGAGVVFDKVPLVQGAATLEGMVTIKGVNQGPKYVYIAKLK
jgi:arylsulfatase A-like enzyme